MIPVAGKVKNDSIVSVIEKECDIPLEIAYRIFDIGFAMVNSGIETSEISEFIQTKLGVSKEKADNAMEYVWMQSNATKAGENMKKAEMIQNVADTIARRYPVISHKPSRKLFMYENGWHKSEDIEIFLERELAFCAKSTYKAHFLESDLKNCLHRMQYNNTRDDSEFNKNKNIIVVKNGLLNIDTGELREHTPDEIYTNYFPFNYDEDLDLCEPVQEFFETVFKGKDMEQQIEISQEFFGYCLCKGYPIQAFLMMLGNGGNGKGSWLNILTKFIGKQNTSALSLHEICSNDKFALADMHGKMLNVCGDIGKETVTASENIKKLTGRDIIRAQFKYGQPFDYYNDAKIAVAGNEMPEFTDGTEALVGRLILLHFNNPFRGEENEDKDIVEKCTTPEALSSILTWAIKGYQRLMKNGKFSHQKSFDEKVNEIYMKSNPMQYFIEKRVSYDKGNFSSRDALFNAYKIFAKENGLPSKGKKGFFDEFESVCKALGIDFMNGQKKIGDKKVRCYHNIYVSLQ